MNAAFLYASNQLLEPIYLAAVFYKHEPDEQLLLLPNTYPKCD